MSVFSLEKDFPVPIGDSLTTGRVFRDPPRRCPGKEPRFMDHAGKGWETSSGSANFRSSDWPGEMVEPAEF